MARTKMIIAATNEYGEAMKDRLREKAEDGFTGWDDEVATPKYELFERIENKVEAAENNFTINPKLAKKHLVDIGNLSMMLYKRLK